MDRRARSPFRRWCANRSAKPPSSSPRCEVAKAIASGFRTELNNHIISHDLLGASTMKHYVATRPQCPTCGSARLRDPRRAPQPIEIKGSTKLVMTSGGYRSVSARATVARHRKHVSPLTGVVTKLERIEADLPMNTNFHAKHNFSAPAENVDQLRQGLSGGSFGKGSTAEQAEASALMELIERYSGIFQGDEIRLTRRFSDFAPGEAILPNDVLLFSDAQSRADHSVEEPSETQVAPASFDPEAKIEWSPVWSLRDGRFKYLPTSLLYFFYSGPAAFQADSNGCAAGNTLEEAIVQGFLELVERDAYAIWWYNQSQTRTRSISTRTTIPMFAICAANWPTPAANYGCSTSPAISACRPMSRSCTGCRTARKISSSDPARISTSASRCCARLTELNQFLSIGFMEGGTGEKPSLDGDTPLFLKNYPFLTPIKNPSLPSGLDFGPLDTTRAQVNACVEIARRAGMDFLVLDQTRPDVEVPVVRVIVPGLRHFYRRFGPGRLYDVPVKLGLRDHPIPESELTPFLPHS